MPLSNLNYKNIEDRLSNLEALVASLLGGGGPLDPDLTALGALTGTGLLRRTGDSSYDTVDPATFQPAGSYAGLASNTFTGQQHIADATDSTNNTTGALVLSGGLGVGKFTTLGGNVAIKVMELTGTTDLAQGGITQVPHGINVDQIISITGVVRYAPGVGGICINYTFTPGYQFDINYDTTNATLINSTTNSANILGKPFSIFIVYKA